MRRELVIQCWFIEHFARGGGGVALVSTSTTLAFNLTLTLPAWQRLAVGAGHLLSKFGVRVGVKFGP